MSSRSHLLIAAAAWVSRVVLALLQLASAGRPTVAPGQPSCAVYALLAATAVRFTLTDFSIFAAPQNMVAQAQAPARQADYAPACACWAAIAAAGGAGVALAAQWPAPWLVAWAAPLLARRRAPALVPVP